MRRVFWTGILIRSWKHSLKLPPRINILNHYAHYGIKPNRHVWSIHEIGTICLQRFYSAVTRPLCTASIETLSIQSTKPSYQLEFIEAGTYTWIIRKRLQAHQDFLEESDDWDDNDPTLLFVCGNLNTDKLIRRLVLNSYLDFEVYTNTEECLTTNSIKVQPRFA